MANKKLPLDPAIRAVYFIFLARVLYELILIEDDKARLDKYGEFALRATGLFDDFYNMEEDLHPDLGLEILEFLAFKLGNDYEFYAHVPRDIIEELEYVYGVNDITSSLKRLPKYANQREAYIVFLARILLDIISQEEDREWLERYKEITLELARLFEAMNKMRSKLKPDVGARVNEFLLLKLNGASNLSEREKALRDIEKLTNRLIHKSK